MSFPDRAPLQLRASIGLVLALAAFALLAWPASAQQPDLPSEPPARPTGLTADVSHDLVALTWDDPGDASITHYEVFRRDRDVHASGEFISITANTGSAETSYTDHTAQPLRRYRYRVKAVNQHGASQWSRFAGAETPEAPIEDHQRDPAPITRDEGSAAVAAVACPDRDTEPTPQSVEVTAVPIVVTSTTAEYFVLYVSHDVDGTELEIPVLLKRGEAGTTTLAENVEALPKERYRVEKYLIADPADIDGDCIDDITELDSLGSMNPYNPAPALETSDGAVAIQDQATFELYAHAASHGNLILKYIIFAMDSGRPSVYFQNTKTYPHHVEFLEAIGLTEPTVSRGVIVYDPALVTPDGRPGVYYYPNNRASNSFGEAALIHTVTAASMPLLDHNLALHLPTNQLLELQAELPTFKNSRIPLMFDEDILPDTNFLALHPAEGYGYLRVVGPDERPHPRDIVLYEALPNELPRVAGIISAVPQTPLSHVNLRAIQNGIPNAFIRDARANPAIAPLIDGFVRYEVTDGAWTLQAATKAEVDAHYESSRPDPQTPQRDLSVTEISRLTDIGFEDWPVFGVKAANVAVLGTLGFPAGAVPEGGTVPIGGTVPDGFAVPFYFYDEFMKAHDFYTRIETMLTNEAFQTDLEVQDDMLDDLARRHRGRRLTSVDHRRADRNARVVPRGNLAALPVEHQQRRPAGVQRGGPVRLEDAGPGRDGGGRHRQVAQGGLR